MGCGPKGRRFKSCRAHHHALMKTTHIKKIDDTTWEISQEYKKGMRVPARVIATEKLLKEMDEGVVEQLTNVTTLPGIVDYAFAMPDTHWGYGCPIGGVFAVDPKKGGVISPGAVGFDINCGVRLIRTNLTIKDVQPRLPKLVDELFKTVPTGVGASGAIPRLSVVELKKIMEQGMQWCIDQGFGWEQDRAHAEERGTLSGADPDQVSQKAIQRGLKQLGTLGSGNHYLEIQAVKKEKIFDQGLAKTFGIFPDQVTIMIHSGSRGLGHQIATDYLRIFEKALDKYKISIPDQQLACAPFNSPEGRAYYAAMAAACNNAFANRQLITHLTRQVFGKVFNNADPKRDLGMELIYDVAHNIAKLEKSEIRNSKLGTSANFQNPKFKTRELLVHRKGATRAFGPKHPQLPKSYHEIGQPVIIGGSMETGSYLLVGTKIAEEKTFGSTAHGSGRTMSRAQAKKQVRGDRLQKEMQRRGIYVRSASMPGLAEEGGFAYKDIHEVVKAVELAGISKPVAAFTPIGNIKG